jgi:hypothetical protein
MNNFDWTGFLIYLLFNTTLWAIGIDIIDNPISWILLNALLVWSDSRSYRNGLVEGGETVKKLWGIK